MMGLDDQLLEHPKFIRAVRIGGSPTVHLWLGMRAFCAQKLTDGYIEPDMLDETRGPSGRERAKALTALRAAGLVHDSAERAACEACRSAPVAAEGLWMHDYLQWAESRPEAQARRISNRDRQRKHRKQSRVSNGVTNGVTGTLVTAPQAKPSQAKPSQTEEIARETAPSSVGNSDPCMNLEETVIPLNLRERATEPGGAIDQLTAHLKLPKAVLLDYLDRKYLPYWTIGKGMGERRSYWLKHLRQQVLEASDRGHLNAPGAIEHAETARQATQAPRQRVLRPKDVPRALDPSETLAALNVARKALVGG